MGEPSHTEHGASMMNNTRTAVPRGLLGMQVVPRGLLGMQALLERDLAVLSPEAMMQRVLGRDLGLNKHLQSMIEERRKFSEDLTLPETGGFSSVYSYSSSSVIGPDGTAKQIQSSTTATQRAVTSGS